MPKKSVYKDYRFDEGDISFMDDILNEMVDETGISYKELHEIVALNIRYIKKLTMDPEVQEITIGTELGRLVTSSMFLSKEIHVKEESEYEHYNEYAKNVLKPRQTNLWEYVRENKELKAKHRYFKRPFLYNLKHQIKRKTGKEIAAFKNPYLIWEALSDFQNEINGE